MRLLSVLLLLSLLVAVPAMAETDPLMQSGNRAVAADVASTGAVAANMILATWHNFHTPDPMKSLGCEGLKIGMIVGASELVKHLVHRTRPDGSDRMSFPSEHTGLTAATSQWNRGVGLSLTGSVALGRMTAGKHYLSDVGVGAGVGFLTSFLCHE